MHDERRGAAVLLKALRLITTFALHCFCCCIGVSGCRPGNKEAAVMRVTRLIVIIQHYGSDLKEPVSSPDAAASLVRSATHNRQLMAVARRCMTSISITSCF
jgi:hypothetical protein